MGTSASLLDLIARGGSMVGANEAAQSSANTALTNAQVPQVQAQVAREQELARTQAQLTRQAQLENQQRELALRDNGIIRDAMTNTEPAANEDPAAYLGRITDYTRKNGISAGGYIGLTKNLAGALETKSKLTGEALTQHGQVVEQAGGLLQALKTAAPEQMDAVYAREQPALDRMEPGVFPAQLPADPAERSALIDQWSASHHVTSALLGQKKTEQEIATGSSEAAKNLAMAGKETAQTPGEAADSKRKQLITDAMQRAQTAQQSGQHPIDAVLDPKSPANASYKAAYDTSMANGGPEAANHIIAAAAAHAAQIDMATNPQVRAGEVAKATAVEQAVAPIRTANQIHAAVQTEVEKAKLAPESFNAIADPRARAAAESDYAKDSKEYADKVAAAAQLQDFVKAAQSGNKAAPGLIPIAEVRQLVNRVNRQELESVSKGAGSAWDRLQGKIGSLTEGEPIPPEILKDISSISDVMKNAARRGYHMKVDINNATHGGKVKPIEFSSEGGGGIPEVTSQAAYDSLPKGAKYTHGGEVLTKQ